MPQDNREPPPMVPSAKDEADQILRIARDYPYSSAATIVSGVIHDTYRDGWNAAQARIAELEGENARLRGEWIHGALAEWTTRALEAESELKRLRSHAPDVRSFAERLWREAYLNTRIPRTQGDHAGVDAIAALIAGTKRVIVAETRVAELEGENARLKQEYENIEADFLNDRGRSAAYKASADQLIEIIGVPRDFLPWQEYVAKAREELARLRASQQPPRVSEDDREAVEQFWEDWLTGIVEGKFSERVKAREALRRTIAAARAQGRREGIEELMHGPSDALVDAVAEEMHEILRVDPRFANIPQWADCDEGWRANDRVKARAAISGLLRALAAPEPQKD